MNWHVLFIVSGAFLLIYSSMAAMVVLDEGRPNFWPARVTFGVGALLLTIGLALI